MVSTALAAVALLAGCSGGPGAAEPATSPPTTAPAAGDVRAVGAEPEGIVYDPSTKLVAVAVHDPDRLLLLDPTTLATTRTVPLPGSARHLELERAGGPVLVPAETADELVEVPLANGSRTVVKVGDQPHDANGAGNGEVVVGNEFGHSISVILGDRVVRTLPGVKQPGGVVGDGSTVAVVDVGDFDVATYDLDALKRTATIPAGAGPTHGGLLTGDRLAVVDTRGDVLLVFGLHPLRRLGHLAVPGTPYGLAIDRTTDTVWLTLTARNQLVGLDVSTAHPRVIARYDTVRQPNSVTVAPGSHTLWVTGTDTGVVERITR